jgi:hypothetical protein
VERSEWTDQRLGDRFDAIDRRFDRVDRDLGDLRSEIRDLRVEMREGFGDQRSLMIRLQLGTFVPILGLIAALVARGG